MEWFSNAFWGALGLLAAYGLILLLVFLAVALWAMWGAIRQWRCPHPAEKVFESGSCRAICRQCGGDLGFIGTWRSKRAAEKANGAA